jgi:hypothetical protein
MAAIARRGTKHQRGRSPSPDALAETCCGSPAGSGACGVKMHDTRGGAQAIQRAGSLSLKV